MIAKEYAIRKAELKDIETVRDLVYELAVYEKEPNALTADLEHYKEQFNAGLFEAMVAEVNGEIVGMTLYYLRFSTWKGKMMHLEDFFVKESFRRFGIGAGLLEAFLEESKHQGCTMAIWQVLDWNEPAINFYEKHNVIFDKDWWNCKVYF